MLLLLKNGILILITKSMYPSCRQCRAVRHSIPIEAPFWVSPHLEDSSMPKHLS